MTKTVVAYVSMGSFAVPVTYHVPAAAAEENQIADQVVAEEVAKDAAAPATEN